MLSSRQQRALSALLTCSTQAEASKQAGISVRTLRNYLQVPEFRDELAKRFSELLADATHVSQRALRPAVETLSELTQDEKQTASIRLASARAVVSACCRLTELHDFDKRLRRLEEALDDSTTKTT